MKKKLPLWFKFLMLCLLLPALFTGCPLINNGKLWRLQRSLATLAHPQGTSPLKEVQEVGNLSGTGNHIDFFVGQVRTYSGPKESIRAFYRSQKFWNPIEGKQEPIKIAFSDEYSEDGDADAIFWSDRINEWSLFTAQKSYVIYAWAGGDRPGFDMRGY